MPAISFVGDVLKLASGAVIAQLLAVLASPILARFYGPEAFGLWALFTSITGIIGVIASLRYELSIMLPESEDEAANLLGVSLIIVLAISLLTVFIIWWGGEILLNLINAPNFVPFMWLVPLTVFFSGAFTVLNYWNTRTRRYGRLSIAQVTTSLSATIGQLGAGVAGFGTGGVLIGASVGGKMLATSVLGGLIWKDDRGIFLRSIRWRKMIQGIKRHRKFPLYGTWSGLLNTISWQLPTFLLSFFFSSTVVGYYALGFRVLQLPMSLVGQAIGQVFFQRATEAKAQGDLAPLVEGAFRCLVMIGLFPMLMIAVIGKGMSVVVFGANWAEAGVYMQILAIWAFFWFTSSPLSILFSVLEKQEFGLKLNGVLFLTRLGSLSLGGYLGDARLALFFFAATGILVYGYLIFSLIIAAGVSWISIWRVVRQGFLYFAPFGLLLLLMQKIKMSNYAILFASVFFLFFYIFILWKKQRNLLHI